MSKRAYKHIHLKTPDEILIMKENGHIIAQIFKDLESFIKPGISTLDIDQYVEKMIRSEGAKPSFKGYGGFTGSICSSINDVVIHGIPNSKDILKEGDIISVDIGVYKNNFHADSARTFGVGIISEQAKNLLEITQKSLQAAINSIKPNKTLFDIANAVQSTIDETKYGIIKEFVGHGVGKELHESPQVPNYRQLGLSKIKLQAGMVLAVEPMISIGSGQVFTLDDGWTVKTKDGGLAAHFEHTIAVTPQGFLILTD